MFGNKQPQKKSLDSILGVFINVKNDLSAFTSDAKAELVNINKRQTVLNDELATAAAAMSQIEAIVPTKK